MSFNISKLRLSKLIKIKKKKVKPIHSLIIYLNLNSDTMKIEP